MKRRALIIYCNNTKSGILPGPEKDFYNFKNHLTNKIGGEWEAVEIKGLHNPTKIEVDYEVLTFMADADYTFTLFSGHGFIDESNSQYMEVSDGYITIKNLRTNAPRQTLIIDACRGIEILSDVAAEEKFFSKAMESTLHLGSTRTIFDNEILRAEKGLSILYSASKNESSDDSIHGAPYLLSLLKVAENWRDNNNDDTILSIKEAHDGASKYLNDNFEDVLQVPTMKSEKRRVYFPFAVKTISLHS